MTKKYIREGRWSDGEIKYNVDEEGKVREGRWSDGEVKYNIDKDGKIHKGRWSDGEIVANIDSEGKLRKGRWSDGEIMYNMDDEGKVHRGRWSSDEIEYNVTEDDNSGGCYVTTACVFAKGLPDDCYELETIRRFRDTWLRNQANGEEEIRTYYEIAPKIVEAFNRFENKKAIWNDIYEKIVLPCVKLIESEKYQAAFNLYKNETIYLYNEYIGE